MNSTLVDPRHATGFLTRAEASEYLRVEVQTLAAWALRGTPALPFTKMGRKVLYRRADLDAFIESRTATSNSALAAR